MKRLLWIPAALLSLMPLWGQSTSGTITGTVTDPTDAVVAGAKVALVSEDTSARREAATDQAGAFTFNSVRPGTYSITIEAAGFKTIQRTNVVLTANAHLPIAAKLEIGAAVETIRVEAQGATVQTASAEQAGLVNATQLSSLMLKGRDFMGLIKLLPGVVDTANRESPTNNSLTGINIQGGRQGTYNLTLDGVTNLDTGSNTGPYFEPSMDAIAEVKVLLSNFQAEYGRNSGASINVVMKSGTRDFHGSGYYYKRNEALNANNFFNNLAGRKRERYRYDLFGFTVGGPVSIPGKFNRDRNKLFFFYSHEIGPQRVPVPIGFRTVPTTLERQGDFSQTLESTGALIAIKDPTTGQVFPGNVIPKSRVNPNGTALLSFFPQPNISSPTRQYNYVYTDTINRPRNSEMLRVDYVINSTTTFYARGILSHEKFEGGIGFTGTSANWPQFPALYDLKGRGLAFNLTKIFSPRVVNELVAGVNRGMQNRGPLSDAALAINQRSKIGLGTLGQFHPEINSLDILPNASFGGVPNAININIESKFPFLGRNNIYNFTDSLSVVRGAHTLKFGIYVEPTSRNARRASIFQGQFDFGRNVNNPLDTNWAFANAALGNFNNYQESDALAFGHGRFHNVEWYVQDNWKVSRRLTLDYGLRFYLIPPNYTSDNRMAGFTPDRWDAKKVPQLYRPAVVGGKRLALNPLTGETGPEVLIGAFVPGSGDFYNGIVVAGQDGYPRGLIDSRGLMFGPRFGFAYDVFGNGKTAVRGGFGMFYDRVQTDVALENVENPPLENTPIVFYNSFSTYLQSKGSLFPSDVKGLSRAGEVPNVMNWSFGIQQSVGAGTVVEAAYIGSVGRHLMVQRNLNLNPYGSNFAPENQDPTSPGKPLPVNFYRPYPGLAGVLYRDFSSSSNYHSLQVQANRRFARQFQYGAAWTWSKAMSFADGNFSQVATWAPLRAWNYGKANFDRTHTLQISYTWDLPRASAVWKNPVAKAALDGWQLSGISTFQSGAPQMVGLSTTDGADIAGGGDGVRPVMLANPVLAKGDRTFERYFNTEAFGRPAKGSFGNESKDAFRGPGLNNWDISLLKNIPLGSESRRLQFRCELYNAWNHTQFSALDTSARFSPDGKQTNTRFGSLTAANLARQVQLSLRILF